MSVIILHITSNQNYDYSFTEDNKNKSSITINLASWKSNVEKQGHVIFFYRAVRSNNAVLIMCLIPNNP